MFKFKLGRKQPEESESRRRLQKELFHFNKISDRGFPTRPSSLAYDSQLNLIAIGTHTGEIRIYGQPAFQLSYTLESTSIVKIVFLTGLARLLVLTHDGYLHLLEINNSNSIQIDRICASNDDDQKEIFKNIQTICILRNNIQLLIGLINGNIYSFNLEQFSLNKQPIIPTDAIENTIGEHCSGRIVHPGSVKTIVQHPLNDDKILIAYKNAVIVHWDLPSNSHDRTYVYKQEVESACWYNQGLNFATCHSNGSYALWDTKQQSNIVEIEKIPYGPYPCTAMTNICVKIMRNDDPLIIFSGGLPRSTYANKQSISCLCENEHNPERTRHVTFDFTSNIIDFFIIDKHLTNLSHDDPQSLVVLLNEEIIVIDLVTDTWPLYQLPYLNSLHTSPVICTTFVSNINREFYRKLINSASIQFEDYSDRKWPITGGEINSNENQIEDKHFLLTGHEDGSVQFWDMTQISMPLIYKLDTKDYYQIEQAENEDIDEETWPPFRKTGQYDPYSDDSRLAIQKLSLCTNTDTLIIAGTAGQLLTFQLTTEPIDVNLTTLTVNLLDGCESFVWKGHDEMKIKSNFISSGFYATSSIQLYPPAAVSALALCSDIHCLAVGTAHGFSLINYQQNRILLSKCTLDSNSLHIPQTIASSTGDATLIRGRSLKKSLRESFRRFRKGRTIKKTMMPKIDETLQLEDIQRVPIERQVESREFKPIDDQINSMVRCLYFAKTYLNSLHDRTRSIWIGTNGGHVYVYSINGLELPTTNGSAIATDYSNPCALAKEIRLKHKAPVLSILVLDNQNQSIGQGSNIPTNDSNIHHSGSTVNSTNNSENPISHKVLISSEEQFKIFTLPHLKPFCKHKLTATEGTRVRKLALNQFTSESHSETCLICLDNMGQISIYSLPTLRRQIIFNCIKPTDILALSSLQFTPYAHAFYLQSSSELAEISFTTQRIHSNTMMISYDKLQRRTIVNQTPSKTSSISSPIEEQVKLDTNINNSGFSTASDSAIDIQSINQQLTIDENVKSVEQNNNEQHSTKKPAPLPPISSKNTSIKTRHAPLINDHHNFNGTSPSTAIQS